MKTSFLLVGCASSIAIVAGLEAPADAQEAPKSQMASPNAFSSPASDDPLLTHAARSEAQRPLTTEAAASTNDTKPQVQSPNDIIVTAQRRSEQLRDVPATVAVTNDATLASAHLTNALEFGQIVPGVQFAVLGNFTEPVIRGVTTQVVGVGNSPNVALYVDGVYVAAQDAYNFDFVGLDNIQTLKGPQGTLYGRNATGGAILVTTKKPSFTFGGDASASYGNFNDAMGKIYLTGPINDKIAFNIAALYHSDDGYIRNIVTGNRVGQSDTRTVRGKLLFKPADDIEFTLGADHSYVSNPIGYDDSTLNGNTIAKQTPGAIIASKPYQMSATFDTIVHVKQTGAYLRGAWTRDDLALTSITSYRHLHAYVLSDNDYSVLPLSRNERFSTENTFTQELNAASNSSGRLAWQLGAFYLADRSGNDPFNSNGVPQVANSVLDHAISAFGELNYHLTNRLVVTAGVRYSDEHKYLNGRYLSGTRSPVENSISAHSWTPRFALRYSPDDNLSVYGSFNKGFKAGGYNTYTSNSTNPLGQVVSFKPETIYSYEVGAKSRLSNWASLDVAAYYSDYKNEQVAAATIINGVATSQVLNAASAKIYGAEAQLRLRPSSELSIQLGAAYTHARNTFPNALLTVPNPAGGNSQFVGSATGNRLVRVPDFTASLGAQYQHVLRRGATMFLSGNAFLSTRTYWDFGNRLSQPQYAVINTQIGYAPAASRLRFSVFAKNIANKTYALLINATGFGDVIVYAPPRTYGAQVDLSF